MRDEEVTKRAAAVAAMPHVQRWIRRFQRVAKDMPPEVWVFAGPVKNGCCVMANDEKGEAMRGEAYRNPDGDSEGVSSCGEVASIKGGHFDGGDF